MSPVVSGGPPHTRASSVHGGPVSMAYGSKGNGTEGLKAVNRVFPHLDDLVDVALAGEMMHWPMRRLLQEAELLAKQADTHLDFRRPDVALQEYIKATIIAVEYIPRHKDYPSLQSDRGEMHRMYVGLNKRITTQHSKFAEVKDIIKENNARSGVLPAKSKSQSQGETNGTAVNGHTRTQSISVGPPNGISVNGNRKKPPPPVQPKPNALHGNAIQSSTSTAPADLAARFARLRSPEPNAPVQQDPRIKTQPIVIPGSVLIPQSAPATNGSTTRPTGPQEFPSVPKAIPRHNKMPLDVQIPSMPRAPDAIYSPASGVENPSAVNFPSSIRSSSYQGHGRKNSAPPVSLVGPTPDLNESRKDYLSSPAHTMSNGDYEPKPPKRQAPDLPGGTSITAEDLVERLRQPLLILIVDLRTRGEFESGHIMAQSVICIEPMTLRTGVSGDQLGDTLVIGSDVEQSLYERRAEFDLVVFYDQSSKSINPSTSFARDSNNILRDFSAAVYDYGYENRVKRRPMLLVGGLDAWVDLLGPNSLESATKDAPATTSYNSNRSIGRFNRVSDNLQRNGLSRAHTRTSRPLTLEEETKWELAVRQEPAPSSPLAETPPEEFVYARTLEGFLNKYPEMPVIQESMVSQTPRYAQTNLDEIESSIPRLPTRPAPALPRQRSSGISDRGSGTVTSYANSAAGTSSSITQLRVSPGLTGLQNPGYLCYMNSAIQALSATPFLRNYLMNFHYPNTLKVPKRQGETTPPPQLMTRFLGNLMAHMWGGQYDFLCPTTLCDYTMSIRFQEAGSEDNRNFCYGGVSRQHDTSEFLLWFTDILDDELNPGRDVSNNAVQGVIPPDEQKRLNRIPLVQASIESLEHLRKGRLSILNQRMDSQECNQTICRTCRDVTRVWNSFRQITLALPDKQTRTLQELLDTQYGAGSGEQIDAIDCGSSRCKGAKKTKDLTRYFTRLPDYLVITIGRFLNVGAGKNKAVINFPETGIDLTKYFCPPDGSPAAVLDDEHRGPFIYNVYAVQQHAGTLTGGHYWTLARSPDLPRNKDGAGEWHEYNDTRVNPCSYSRTQNDSTYMIYLVRTTTDFTKK